MPIRSPAAGVKRLEELLKYRPVPAHLKVRQRSLPPSGEERLAASLARHFFPAPPEDLTDEMRNEFSEHVIGCTEKDRKTVVPWLDSLFRLQDSKIIEIGCGTGAATVALAEQGAQVVGYDIDSRSLTVAAERLAVYGLKANLIHANATEIPSTQIASANAVIFFATLEHMTLDERLEALSLVWNSLRSGAYLAVVDTPNRLWWYDTHTAHLPFYLWLPDEVAIHYSRFSPRPSFKQQLKPPVTADSLMKLARIGRATSYHEFELALGDLSDLQVSSLNRWRRASPAYFANWFVFERPFEKWLRSHGPRIDRAFFESALQCAIRKP